VRSKLLRLQLPDVRPASAAYFPVEVCGGVECPTLLPPHCKPVKTCCAAEAMVQVIAPPQIRQNECCGCCHLRRCCRCCCCCWDLVPMAVGLMSPAPAPAPAPAPVLLPVLRVQHMLAAFAVVPRLPYIYCIESAEHSWLGHRHRNSTLAEPRRQQQIQ
jgi:hypothetical protein